MFKIGDVVFVAGVIAEVVKILEVAGQTLYTVLVQQPGVKVLTEQQLTGQPAPVRPPVTPAPTPPGVPQTVPGTAIRPV